MDKEATAAGRDEHARRLFARNAPYRLIFFAMRDAALVAEDYDDNPPSLPQYVLHREWRQRRVRN